MLDKVVIFLNGISYFSVVIILILCILKCHQKKLDHLRKALYVFAATYFIMGSLYVLWLANYVSPTKEEYLVTHAIILLIAPIFFFLFVYSITKNKNLFYLLFLYALSFYMWRYGFFAFFFFTALSSSLFLVILFLDLVFARWSEIRNIGVYGTVYSYLTIGVLMLFLYESSYKIRPWFIPNMALFLVCYFVLRELERFEPSSRPADKPVKLYLFAKTVRFFIFVSVIMAFMLISTISVHEMGHAMAGRYYQCRNVKSVVYDIKDSPHTEMSCEAGNFKSKTIIVLAGTILPLLLALILFFTDGELMKNIAFIISGYALILAYNDISVIYPSTFAGLSLTLVGILLLVAGIIKIGIEIAKMDTTTPFLLEIVTLKRDVGTQKTWAKK